MRDGKLDENIKDVRLIISPGLALMKIEQQKSEIKVISYKLKRAKEVDNMMRALSDHQIQMVIKDSKKVEEIFGGDI